MDAALELAENGSKRFEFVFQGTEEQFRFFQYAMNRKIPNSGMTLDNSSKMNFIAVVSILAAPVVVMAGVLTTYAVTKRAVLDALLTWRVKRLLKKVELELARRVRERGGEAAEKAAAEIE